MNCEYIDINNVCQSFIECVQIGEQNSFEYIFTLFIIPQNQRPSQFNDKFNIFQAQMRWPSERIHIGQKLTETENTLVIKSPKIEHRNNLIERQQVS